MFPSFGLPVPEPYAAAATPKPGKNVIAVHRHQISGGQYVDVGIVVPKEREKGMR